MDTPAAAPNQLGSSRESDIVPHVASSVPWVTFGGSLDESSGAFVQCVQRIGFQQGRSKDDEWLAEYAATCFEGDAIVWYAELEDEVRESWKKLRAALLRKYPPTAGGRTPSPWPNAPDAGSVTPVTPSAGSLSANPNKPQPLVGRIVVVGHNTTIHGSLSLTPDSGIDLTTDQGKALSVSFLPGGASDVLHLDMLNAPNRVLSHLGVALLVPQHDDQNTVPNVLSGTSTSHGSIGKKRIDFLYNAPTASGRCKVSPSITSGELQLRNPAKFATWTLSACGESRKAPLYRRRADTIVSGARAAAAVWKYDTNIEELRIVWLMDDDTECELGAYVHGGTSDQLHLHRISDMGKTGGSIDEDRVRFIFHPTS